MKTENKCVTCGKKIVFGKSKADKFILNKPTEVIIQKYLDVKFNKWNPIFAIAICTSCRLSLYERENGKCSKRPLPKMPNYNKITLQKSTIRALSNNYLSCNCFICKVARMTSHAKKGTKKKWNKTKCMSKML